MSLTWPLPPAFAALLLSAGATCACGLEDPGSIAALRGALQLAYPNALHVGTAVWQAQLADELPRDALAQRGDLSPEARSTLRMVRASAMLQRLAARLSAGDSARHPALALVLVGPVLWTRFEAGEGRLRVQVHASGPELGDVVAVTDLAVIEAIADGALDVPAAIRRGLLRLYGPESEVASTNAWLAASTRS